MTFLLSYCVSLTYTVVWIEVGATNISFHSFPEQNARVRGDESGHFPLFFHFSCQIFHTQNVRGLKETKEISQFYCSAEFFCRTQNVRTKRKEWKEILFAPTSIQTTVMSPIHRTHTPCFPRAPRRDVYDVVRAVVKTPGRVLQEARLDKSDYLADILYGISQTMYSRTVCLFLSRVVPTE
jgi:hypothetical protein